MVWNGLVNGTVKLAFQVESPSPVTPENVNVVMGRWLIGPILDLPTAEAGVHDCGNAYGGAHGFTPNTPPEMKLTSSEGRLGAESKLMNVDGEKDEPTGSVQRFTSVSVALVPPSPAKLPVVSPPIIASLVHVMVVGVTVMVPVMLNVPDTADALKFPHQANAERTVAAKIFITVSPLLSRPNRLVSTLGQMRF